MGVGVGVGVGASLGVGGRTWMSKAQGAAGARRAVGMAGEEQPHCRPAAEIVEEVLRPPAKAQIHLGAPLAGRRHVEDLRARSPKRGLRG